jgi:uncharacterized protein YbjT (DUF2867 family)
MILVVGATGLLGGAITRQLLENGNVVRILVRENSPSAALEQSDDHIPMAATAERFGIEPTSLETFAGRFFGARAA